MCRYLHSVLTQSPLHKHLRVVHPHPMVVPGLLLRDLHINSTMTAPTYTPTNNKQSSDCPTSSPSLLSFVFLVTGLQWNSQVALICILLMAKDVECFFKYVLAAYISSLRTLYYSTPFTPLMICFGEIQFLEIFWSLGSNALLGIYLANIVFLCCGMSLDFDDCFCLCAKTF